VACRVLNISRSGFYDWLGRPEPPRELRNRELMKIIREIHAGSRGRKLFFQSTPSSSRLER
jgi:putative transposase